MYNNYMNTYSPQMNIDKIDEQISNLQKLRNQIQQPLPQPTNLTQNFQLAPTRDAIRYAGSIEEVQREAVVGETPYFSKDMSVVWIKNGKGNIKSYELTEIIPKDEKDFQIELLQEEIRELKGMIMNEQRNTNATTTEDKTDTTEYDETTGTTIKENKSPSIQKLPTSKKK